MKNFLENFLRHFFRMPLIPYLVVMCAVFMVFLTADSLLAPKEEIPDYTRKMSAFQLSVPPESTELSEPSENRPTDQVISSVTSSTTATSTTDTSTTSTTATTTTTTAVEEQGGDSETTAYQPPVYDYSYIAAGESPNSGYYQDRLTIIGDSIAYGFNAYGYIPYAHNIARESLAVWNMYNYSFDLGGGSMNLIDAAAYANSSLYYLSIGMNDIFTYTADDYAWNIRWIAEDILARVPDAVIVVGAITPVSEGNYYTTNDRIRDYNASLEWVINDLGSEQVLYFDANYVLCDLNTMTLGWDFAGGDGLHLNSSAYRHILSCLFNFLDMTNASDYMAAHDGGD